MVFSGKEAAARESIDYRRRVSAGDVHSIVYATFILPRYSNAMRGIFTADAKCARNIPWPDVFKPNKADSRHCVASLKLRMKRRRQLALNYLRVDAVIHE